MDRLTPEEAMVYEEIDPHASATALKYLIPADEIVEDMNTPLGRKIMHNLHSYRREAAEDIIDALGGNKPITETQRIEYKQINLLIEQIEGVVIRRETIIRRIRRVLSEML